MANMLDHHPRIWIDPARMGGQPCVRGTRVPVAMIVDFFARGETMADVLEAYDFLTEDDVRAAQAFAADYLRNAVTIAAE